MKQFDKFLEASNRKMVALKFREDTVTPHVFFQPSVGHNDANGYFFTERQYKLYWDKYLFGEQVSREAYTNVGYVEYLIFKFHDLSQEVQAGPSLLDFTVEKLIKAASSKFPVVKLSEIHNIDIIPVELLAKEDQVDAMGGLF